MPESVQSCFELSIHFPVFFFRELFLVAVHGWFAIRTNGRLFVCLCSFNVNFFSLLNSKPEANKMGRIQVMKSRKEIQYCVAIGVCIIYLRDKRVQVY